MLDPTMKTIRLFVAILMLVTVVTLGGGAKVQATNTTIGQELQDLKT